MGELSGPGVAVTWVELSQSFESAAVFFLKFQLFSLGGPLTYFGYFTDSNDNFSS